jgi:hypothetical protein
MTQKGLSLEDQVPLCHGEAADKIVHPKGLLTFYDKTAFFANYEDEIILFKQMFGKFKPYDSLMLVSRKGRLTLFGEMLAVA